MALSGITPAAIFSYLGLEKYGKKLSFSWGKESLAFDADLQRHALEYFVKRHIYHQLKGQVTINKDTGPIKGWIRPGADGIFTFYVNYNAAVISVQRTDGGWTVLWENENDAQDFALPFIMALENKLFN